MWPSGGPGARGALDAADSRGARGAAAPELPPELTGRGEDLLKLGPGLVLPLEPWRALEVGYWAGVRGKTTIRSRGLSIGFSFVE